MFSEYASKYLSKSQRPAPLFHGGEPGDSDANDYLEAVSGSTDDAYSDSISDSTNTDDDSRDADRESQLQNPREPPSELLTERPPQSSKIKRKQKRGYSLWKQNVDAWNQGQASSPLGDPSGPTSPPMQSAADRVQAASAEGRGSSGNDPRFDPEMGGIRSRPYERVIGPIYLISLAFSLTTAVLVALSASASYGNHIYPIFAYSAQSLICYAMIAALISIVWLHCIRNFPKAVVQTSIFAVPAILVGTSFFSIVMSIHSTTLGWHGLAHAAMRFSALVPLAIASLWVLYLRRVKDVTGKAADIVALSADVYNQCATPMTTLTVTNGLLSLTITGLWTYFLAKAFLEGRVGFILVIWFSFMYLWTWGVVCSLLRTVLAIMTSTWYAQRTSESSEIVEGILGLSIYRAVTLHFNSICFNALLAVIVRAPLLLLPSRLSHWLEKSIQLLVSTSATRLLNPLTLPTSVIGNYSLSEAARVVGSPRFLAVDQRAYRLAKLFLVAGRLCCSLLVGFIAWAHADRVKDVSSVHGYLIAIVAWLIGWTVMGSSENMLSMISDALLTSYVLNPESPKASIARRLFGVNEEEARPIATSSQNDSYSD